MSSSGMRLPQTHAADDGAKRRSHARHFRLSVEKTHWDGPVLRIRRIVEAAAVCLLMLSRIPQLVRQMVVACACALSVAVSCLVRSLRSHPSRSRARGEPQPELSIGMHSALPQLPDDVALLILARLRLVDLASFGQCSRATHALSISPALWKRIEVPQRIESISRAVAAIPRTLTEPCVIAIAGGVHVEGRARSRLHRLLGMDGGQRGIRICRPVILEPASEGEEAVIECDGSDALTILPGAESTVLRRLTVRTLSFASHAVAVYADDVRIEHCALQASGRNSCGVVVTGRGVRARIDHCSIAGCGGGGVLLAYGVGPVAVSDTSITGNGWSGIGAFSGASLVISRCEIRTNKMYAVGVARDVSVTIRDQPSMAGNELGGLHRYLAPPLHPQISMQSR